MRTDFITPADMSDEEINVLGTDMCMSILFRALAELPNEQIQTLLEASRMKEVAERTTALDKSHPSSILRMMMYQTMSSSAKNQILNEIEIARNSNSFIQK